MNPLVPFTADIVRALGWAILHSIWQTFFIWACLRLMLRLLPSASARIKYNLSYLSLSGAFVWFVVTFCQQWQALRQAAIITQQLVALTGQQVTLPATVAAPYRNQQALMGLFPSLEGYFPLLVAVYMAGVIIMGVKMIADLHQLSGIRKRQLHEPDLAWKMHLQKLADQLDIRGHVDLFISHYLQVPVMIGFFKPVILLPVALFTNLQPDQVEAILLHELAHIKRNDYLLNIFQTIVETTLFFNPFIWWISKNIRLEREHCCDDLVIARMDQPLGYAKALVALEEYRLNSNPLAMAAASKQQHLFHRIKRIMEMKTKNLNYSQKILALLIVATGLFSIAWLNPVRSKQRAEKAPKAKADTTINGTLAATKDSSGHYTTVYFSTNDSAAPAPPVPPPPPPPGMMPIAPVPPVGPDAAPDAPLPPPPPNFNMNFAYTFNADSANNIVFAATPNTVYQFDNHFVFDTMPRKVFFTQDVNVEEAMLQANKAMKAVDWKKINAEVDEAMKKVDWNKIDKEITKAMKDVDTSLPGLNTEAFKAQLRSSVLQKAQMQAMRQQWAANKAAWDAGSKERQKAMQEAMKARQAALEEAMKARGKAMTSADRARVKELRDAQRAQEDAMRAMKQATAMQIHFTVDSNRHVFDQQRARWERDAAEDDRRSSDKYRALIGQLQSDKLIDTTSYDIQKQGDDLYINGKKQPADVANKYRSFFPEKGDVRIKGSDKSGHRSLNIDVDTKD